MGRLPGKLGLVEQCVKQHTGKQHCQYHYPDVELRDVQRHRLA